MDKLLAFLGFFLAINVMIFAYPAGPSAVLFGSACAVIAVIVINKKFEGDEKIFLRRVFLVALILRVLLATVTYVFELQSFFGGDSLTYDELGKEVYNHWFVYKQSGANYATEVASEASGSGFGMTYIVAAIYTLVGRNPLATQLFNSVLGAATACLIYACAKKIFFNTRVARTAAILVAAFPSLVLWSSQGLKDGIICFLLAMAINNLLALQKNFNYTDVILLLISLIGIYTLRFYIFFAFAVAIFGAFFLGTQKSFTTIARQVIILIFITLGLTYLGVLRNAQTNLETYGDLERLQKSRLDQVKSASSGFGEDIDVSTPTGALQVLPVGLTYLMLAPFPWQVSNFRQLITLPEVFFWWGLIPFMIVGFWHTLKNKLRESISVILLTLLLTVSYAIFQGNVGTAYRMRAQMQIFYLIFVAAGLIIWKEKRENESSIRKDIHQRIAQRQALLGKQSSI